ncbi:LysR family substrate-binding domain-containing protein [Aldersonia sp. NBC_00410]|uniref:LysR family substrate-binding domain-containing protein n=1 Tax=Aldersonia sp. NBC_00410 TaxID=2975954 RepID=UPI0022552980|nr:LysR family substrate-binding domain-containing protein [Aldersonia sp. NBC_00410]MCX5042596.1 LysR family substrate-binding domain-containing protein [Aldersonia sp. NBC_00410]
MTEPSRAAAFRIAYVPGVTPAKWVRVWRERRPDVPLELVDTAAATIVASLWNGAADAGLVRLPINGDRLSVIPLYEETPVVVVPKDHLFTAVDEIAVADLDGETVLHPYDDTLEWAARPGTAAVHRPESTSDAIELVAAGVGLLVVPQSLARLHHRRDLTFRSVRDAPASPVALAWPAAATTDLVEEFVGIVRGRGVNSSRGATAPPPKRTASQKAAAKRATRAAAGKPAKPGKRGRR